MRNKIKKNSLKNQLLITTFIPITILWLVCCSLTTLVVNHELNEIFDSSLQETAQRILSLSLAELKKNDVSITHEFNTHEEYLTYQVINNSGKVVLKSHRAPQIPFLENFTSGFRDTKEYKIYAELTSDGDYHIQVAEPNKHRSDTLLKILLYLFILLFGSYVVILLSTVMAIKKAEHTIQFYANYLNEVTDIQIKPVDITTLPRELQPVATAVNNLIEKLIKSINTAESFSGNVAHEIKTPISVCVGNIDLLLSQLASDDSKVGLLSTRSQLLKINILLDKLLQLSKSNSGSALNHSKINLNSLVAFNIEDIRKKFPDRTFIFKSTVKLIYIYVDIDAISIAINNLLENSIKHSIPTSNIQIELTNNGELIIENECAPINQETLKKILLPHFKLDNNYNTGHGLGLTIVQNILQQSNATINLSSPIPFKTQGFQATITFKLASN